MSSTRGWLFVGLCAASGLSLGLGLPWLTVPFALAALLTLALAPARPPGAEPERRAFEGDHCFLCGAPLSLEPGERGRCESCGISQVGQ